MTYQQGVLFMKNAVKNAINKNEYANTHSPYNQSGVSIKILYPGYKQNGGDYRMVINGSSPPKHTDIVNNFHQMTTISISSINQNNANNPAITPNRIKALIISEINQIIDFLDSIYINGLNHVTTLGSNEDILKNIIYWITLQEDINYPRPKFRGIRLSYCRFYEGILSAFDSNLFPLATVHSRTNNHGKGVPSLYNNIPTGIKRPSFYY